MLVLSVYIGLALFCTLLFIIGIVQNKKQRKREHLLSRRLYNYVHPEDTQLDELWKQYREFCITRGYTEAYAFDQFINDTNDYRAWESSYTNIKRVHVRYGNAINTLHCILYMLALGCMFSHSAFAQAVSIPVSYLWDASLSPAPAPDNPIKYRLYVCTDEKLTSCAQNDAGTSTTITVNMGTGSYWVYVRAYCFSVSAMNPDGPYTGGPIMESPNSNIVATRITIPPGNPSNFKIKIQ